MELESSQPHEKLIPPLAPEVPAPLYIPEQDVLNIFSVRLEQLESFKPALSRKLYFYIEEKLNREQKTLQRLLDWQQGKTESLSHYSLVLDNYYFEQKFLNT